VKEISLPLKVANMLLSLLPGVYAEAAIRRSPLKAHCRRGFGCPNGRIPTPLGRNAFPI